MNKAGFTRLHSVFDLQNEAVDIFEVGRKPKAGEWAIIQTPDGREHPGVVQVVEKAGSKRLGVYLHGVFVPLKEVVVTMVYLRTEKSMKLKLFKLKCKLQLARYERERAKLQRGVVAS